MYKKKSKPEQTCPIYNQKYRGFARCCKSRSCRYQFNKRAASTSVPRKYRRPRASTHGSTIDYQIGRALLYMTDIDCLWRKGIPLRTAIRDSLFLYCRALSRVPALPAMTDEDRIHFILNGMPGKELLHDRPRRPAAEPSPVKGGLAARPARISHTPPPDMSTWTKLERDEWIWKGDIPKRFNGVTHQGVICDV